MSRPIQRRSWPPWVRWPSLLLAYLLLVPIVKVLEWTGRWPAALGRGTQRISSEFGDYKPGEHDVLICSYFKSGTTWTMQIAVQVAYRGRAEFEHIHDLVPWPELKDKGRFAVPVEDNAARDASPTGLKIVKTHVSMPHVPFDERARYICVVRDPKDIVVSSYFFLAPAVAPVMPSFQQWVDLFLSENTPFGSWAEHLSGCWDLRHRDNVLFLTYEEMLADVPGAVDRIAALMGVELMADERAAVIERAAFDYMKGIGRKFDPIGLNPPWAANRGGTMVRRGRSGGSDELLSLADRKRIDAYWQAELRRLGCDFPYARAFKLA